MTQRRRSTADTVTVDTSAIDVREWLAQSRAAHSEYRRLSQDAATRTQRLPPAIGHPLLEKALRARLEAQAADPGHTDPSWSEDTVGSEALVAFYKQQLGVAKNGTQ